MRGLETASLALLAWGLATVLLAPSIRAADERSRKPERPDPTLEEWRLTRYEELRGRQIFDITNGRDGSLWFATSSGVSVCDGLTWRHWSVEDGLGDGDVRTVLARRDGSVLAGGHTGIWELVGDHWTPAAGTPRGPQWFVDSLSEARDGSTWGTTNWGALRLLGERCILFCTAVTACALSQVEEGLELRAIPDEVIPVRPWKRGIGVRFAGPGDGWLVTAVAEGGAAERAGVAVGDRVLSVRKDLTSTMGETFYFLTCVKRDGPTFEVRVPLEASSGVSRRFRPSSVAEGRDGRLYVGGSDGEVYRFDPALEGRGEAWSLLLSHHGDRDRSRICVGLDGSIWAVGEGRSSIIRVDTEERISLDAPDGVSITRLAGSPEESLWAIAGDALYSRRGGLWRANTGLSKDAEPRRLHLSTTEELWIADERGIVTRVEVGTERLESFADLRYLCRTREGEEWFSERSTKTFRVRSDGRWETREVPELLGSVFIDAIALARGGVLAYGGNKGEDTLVRWRDGAWSPVDSPRLDIVNPQQNLLCQGPDGQIWFGPGIDEHGHLAILTGREGPWRLVPTPAVEGTGVATLAMRDGTVWTTTRSGLYRLVDEAVEPVILPLRESCTGATALAVDGDRLWVGTSAHGVYCLEGGVWRWIHSQDQPRNHIIDLECVTDGSIWAATQAGLCRVDGTQLRLEHGWFRMDGVDLRASYDGALWIHEPPDLIRFTPETTPPETWISAAPDVIAGPSAAVDLSWGGQDPWRPDTASELTWSYRIDAGEWSPYSTETHHTFEGLGPGLHEIEVRSRDSSSNVDPTPASTTVEIVLPLWRRAWFLLLVTAGLGALLVQTARMSRRDRRLREARARAEAAETARERIEAEVAARVEAEEAQRALQLELLRAQKLEAIGRLAGGIAHDFNNILTAIRGNTSLLARLLTRLGSLHDIDAALAVDGIRVATDRAKALVGQLLTVGRRQATRPEVVEPNAIIEGMRVMLERLLEDHVSLELVPGEDSGSILVDRSMFEQVIMNLVVNARDAMPDGGRVTIRTERSMLDEREVAAHADCRPGPYLRLVVEDEGVGIPRATMEHIFEPFFTTKPIGKGTGLGLSTVLAVVRQCRGFVTVASEPGAGSRFEVYWPSTANEAPREQALKAPAVADGRGAETILVCEDDPVIRELVARALERESYEVLTADSGEDALDLLTTYEGTISVLITDLILPGMTGTDLAEAARAVHPELAVLFMSGQVEELLRDRDALPEGAALLRKPFTIRTLLDRVRECLVPA